MPTVDKEQGSTMVISPPQKRSRMNFLKVYNKVYFCDILAIYVDIFNDYVKNRLHPEGLIWSVQTIREVHSRPMVLGLKWVPYSPSLVGGGVNLSYSSFCSKSLIQKTAYFSFSLATLPTRFFYISTESWFIWVFTGTFLTHACCHSVRNCRPFSGFKNNRVDMHSFDRHVFFWQVS